MHCRSAVHACAQCHGLRQTEGSRWIELCILQASHTWRNCAMAICTTSCCDIVTASILPPCQWQHLPGPEGSHSKPQQQLSTMLQHWLNGPDVGWRLRRFGPMGPQGPVAAGGTLL